MLFLLVNYSISSAQNNKADVELWTGPKVKYGINKNLRLDLEYQLRLDEGLSNVKNTFNEFGLRIKAADFFYIKPSYRLSYGNPNDIANRLMTDLYLKLNKKGFPFRFTYRFRYQSTFIVNKDENRETRERMFRNRVGLEYNLSKWMDPSLSYELFWHQEQFADMRIVLKLGWRINKRIDLDTFYGLERELGEKGNDITHILGVVGTFNFKRKVKK